MRWQGRGGAWLTAEVPCRGPVLPSAVEVQGLSLIKMGQARSQSFGTPHLSSSPSPCFCSVINWFGCEQGGEAGHWSRGCQPSCTSRSMPRPHVPHASSCRLVPPSTTVHSSIALTACLLSPVLGTPHCRVVRPPGAAGPFHPCCRGRAPLQRLLCVHQCAQPVLPSRQVRSRGKGGLAHAEHPAGTAAAHSCRSTAAQPRLAAPSLAASISTCGARCWPGPNAPSWFPGSAFAPSRPPWAWPAGATPSAA